AAWNAPGASMPPACPTGSGPPCAAARDAPRPDPGRNPPVAVAARRQTARPAMPRRRCPAPASLPCPPGRPGPRWPSSRPDATAAANSGQASRPRLDATRRFRRRSGNRCPEPCGQLSNCACTCRCADRKRRRRAGAPRGFDTDQSAPPPSPLDSPPLTGTTGTPMLDAIRWDTELIRRYDQAAPRYPSYPTVEQFHSGVGSFDLLHALRASRREHRALSLYVHLPFCASACYNADRAKVVPKGRSCTQPYLKHLEREFALVACHLGADQRVEQPQLGGGTPTFLYLAELRQLMQALRTHFNLL